MTPAPISVERLRDSLEIARRDCDRASRDDNDVVLHQGDMARIARLLGEAVQVLPALPTLLHQLAERDAEVAKWRERSEANERVRIEMMGRFNEAASDLRAAECARDEATEDAATERALQRAAEKLPDGWEISVVVENGAGWVTLHDPEGELVEFEDSDRTIAQQVTEATDTAIAALLAASGGK